MISMWIIQAFSARKIKEGKVYSENHKCLILYWKWICILEIDEMKIISDLQLTNVYQKVEWKPGGQWDQEQCEAEQTLQEIIKSA